MPLGSALLVAALGAVPAHAAVSPNAVYGGGGVTPAAPLIGLRVSGRGDQVAFEGQAIAGCANGEAADDRVTIRAPLRGAGFSGYATRAYRLNAGQTRTVGLAVAGRVLDGRRAAGTMRLTVLVRRRGRAVLRCDSRVQHWEGRSVPGVEPGPPAPRGGVAYYGGTAQTRYVPLPFALRVSGDARQVDTALFRVFRRCTGAVSNTVANNMPPAAIQDGTFVVVQRYSERLPDSIEDFTFALAGRFTPGGASGRLRATSVLRDPRTRRVIGRCDSGPVAWGAVP